MPDKENENKPITKPGHKELKPVKGNQGLTVCMGGKNWISSTIKEFKDKKGKLKNEISLSKTRFVPETVIAALKLPDHLFVGGPDKPKKKPVPPADNGTGTK